MSLILSVEHRKAAFFKKSLSREKLLDFVFLVFPLQGGERLENCSFHYMTAYALSQYGKCMFNPVFL